MAYLLIFLYSCLLCVFCMCFFFGVSTTYDKVQRRSQKRFKFARRKKLASIKDARKLFQLVERAQTRWQDQKLRVLADADTRLETARAEYSRVSCIKKLMIWEHARSLVDINKRLESAREEVERALSAKITVLRQQQGEAEIWQNIFAQIGEETAKEAAS